MNFTMPDFLPVLPEMVLLGLICLILLVDLFMAEHQRIVTWLMAQATLVVVFILTLFVATLGERATFGGSFVLDPLAIALKLALLLTLFMVLLYGRDYLNDRGLLRGELLLLMLFALLGMMVMVSSGSLLTLYLGLELQALSLYALVALQRESSPSTEAAMKYFVLGAMASAMLLYGMSIIYGVTGTIDLAEIQSRIASGSHDVILVFGLIFIIVGVAFKLGVVPFHMWVPDVYHGAPTAISQFLSTAPKLAAFAMTVRLIAEGLAPLQESWQPILILIAVLSLAIGNIVAIAQSNLKRMLAYSGISHMGFMLIGILAGTPEGVAASLFYTLVYVVMGLAGFGLILLMARSGFEAENLDDYRGLNQRSPWLALMVMLVMFSMAGVPPFLGFWAKFAVLSAAVEVGLTSLAVIAVLFSVIGAFYYLRIIKLVYFDAPQSDQPPLTPSQGMQIIFSGNALTVLAMGAFPASLLAWCATVVVGQV
jgi:NADH-quinone oxidoreductase subunit N